jgi:hypothetical protein
MKNAMKSAILRILISAILFSLISGIVVSIAGLMLGWKTATQFSDGFFRAGSIMISLGLLSVMGGYSERAMSGPQYSQSALHLDMAERYERWAADISHGHRILAFLGISGLLLLGLAGLALLVGRLF